MTWTKKAHEPVDNELVEFAQDFFRALREVNDLSTGNLTPSVIDWDGDRADKVVEAIENLLANANYIAGLVNRSKT